MTLSTVPPLLINATGKPVWVLAGDSPVRLKNIPAPELIGMPSRNSEYSSLHVRPSKYYWGEPTELEVDGASDLLYTCERIPSVKEGVLYLVTPESFAQFPYRSDFVCPSSYLMMKKKEKTVANKKGRGKKKSKKKGKKTARVKYRSVLSSVTYEPELIAWSEEDLPPSLHDAVFSSRKVSTSRPSTLSSASNTKWAPVEFPHLQRDPAQTEDEYQARLASDIDFFFGPTATVEKNDAANEAPQNAEVTVEEPVNVTPPVYAPPSAWVKGVGVVDWETVTQTADLSGMSAEEIARMEENAAAVRYLLGIPAVIPDDEDDENHPT